MAREKIGGIYAITVTRPDGSLSGFYIGSAVDFDSRRSGHMCQLRRGRHFNRPLQAAWRKYGEAAFRFIPVCMLPRDERLAVESRLLRVLATRPDCYNVAIDALSGMAGRRHSPETREKLKLARARRAPLSPESRAKIGSASRGRQRPAELVERFRDQRRRWWARRTPEERAAAEVRLAAMRDEKCARRAASPRAIPTHCGKGHALENNVRVRQRGSATEYVCLACQRERNRRHKAKCRRARQGQAVTA